MTELKPFQIEGVRAIYNFRGRALLADEQGLGKTIQALDWIRRIPKRRPVVIVVPASVKYTWQAEAALHFNMRTEVLEGRAKGKHRRPPCDIIILNYDILTSWLKILRRWKPRCVVLDEVHYIQNRSTDRTRAVLKLVKGVDSVVGLSGTPLVNRPVELWPTLKAIRPDLFPSFSEFAWRYCQPRYTHWGWKYTGATNKAELHGILQKECMIRRLKKDVLKELPDKIRQAVPLKLSRKAEQEYAYAEKHFLEWLKEQSAARANRAKKMESLAKVGYLLRLCAKLKLEQTIAWIENFLVTHPGEKLVCFTMHRKVIDRLKEKFGSRALVIDGRVKGKMRHETVRQFQSNKRKDLMFGNWKAAGIGITLTAAAYVVSLDFPWTPGLLAQGEDRLHRIGQKRRVMVYYLFAKGTIEEGQVRILKRKRKILRAILDGDADVSDLDIFEELLKGITHASKN